MTAASFDRIQALFEGALEHEGAERAAYLDAQCGDDQALREEIEALLAADAEPDALVDHSLVVPPSVEVEDRPVPVGTEIGGYVVERELGHGGFGRVYRAVHPVIGKPAAIKVLYPRFSSSQEHAKRFVNEARAVNEIRHPDIVDVFAFGELPDGCLYFVMELIEGPTLRQWLAEQGPLPRPVALSLLSRLAEAVDAAHARGIVHRDLKPSNVLVQTEPDGALRPRLVDFGIAKLRRHDGTGSASSHGETTGEQIIGTPAYMSPEQARGLPIDKRTDVYAFGVLAYEVLTGRLPFVGTSALDLLVMQVETEPEPPSHHVASLGPVVDAVVLQMLAKDPRQRPTSLRAAIDRMREPELESLPPSRGRGSIAMSAVLGAAAVAGIAWLWASREPSDGPSSPPPIAPAQPTVVERSGVPNPPSLAVAVPSAEATPSDTVPSADAIESITLEITRSPAGTRVLDDEGTVLGEAPGPLLLPRSSEPRPLLFRCDGFEDARRDVVPDRDRTLEVELDALPSRSRRRLNPDLESPFR